MPGDFYLNERFFNRGSRIVKKPYVMRRFAIPNYLDRKERYKASLRHKYRMAEAMCELLPEETGAGEALSQLVDDLMREAETSATTAAEAEETIRRQLERISPALPARVNQLAKAYSDRGVASSARDAVKKAIMRASYDTLASRRVATVSTTSADGISSTQISSTKSLGAYTPSALGPSTKSTLLTLAAVAGVAYLLVR